MCVCVCVSVFVVHRNRLESNSEHWNALLLSLRELIEWVIRKDTELTGLGPVGGEPALLHKQQVSALDFFTEQTIFLNNNKRIKKKKLTLNRNHRNKIIGCFHLKWEKHRSLESE